MINKHADCTSVQTGNRFAKQVGHMLFTNPSLTHIPQPLHPSRNLDSADDRIEVEGEERKKKKISWTQAVLAADHSQCGRRRQRFARRNEIASDNT